MGCGGSKNQGVQDIPAISDLSKLDRFSRVEHSFPLYRMRIDVFESKVKKFVLGKNTVTLHQLREAFKDEKKFEEIQNNDSFFVQVLKSDFFADEKNPEEINIHSLILWGLLLCPGDNALKARVLYDVLQDSMQEMISSGDKDFTGSLTKLVELGTKLVYRFEKEVNSGESNVPEDRIDKDLIDELSENFLDTVFESSSKLERKIYLELVAKKAPWIFSGKLLREKIETIKPLN